MTYPKPAMVPQPVQQQQGRDVRADVEADAKRAAWGGRTVKEAGRRGGIWYGYQGQDYARTFHSEAEALAWRNAPTMVPQPCQQQQARATRPVRVSIRDNALGGLWQGEGVTPEAAFNRARVDAPRAGMGTDTRDAFSAAWLHHSNGQAVSSATRGDVTVTIETAITTVQQP